MKLTFRFLLLVGALLLAVGASTLAGWQAISSLDAALARAVDNDMQRLLAITHARRVFRSMTLSERDHILASSAPEREALAKKITSLGIELGMHLTQYSARMPEEDRAAIAAIQGLRERWLGLNRRVVGVANEDRKLALELSNSRSSIRPTPSRGKPPSANWSSSARNVWRLKCSTLTRPRAPPASRWWGSPVWLRPWRPRSAA